MDSIAVNPSFTRLAIKGGVVALAVDKRTDDDGVPVLVHEMLIHAEK